MMFSVTRWFILVCVLLTTLFPAISLGAQDATPVTTDTLFVDPAGRFTAPIPTNWIATLKGEVAVLTSPEDELIVYLVITNGPDVTSAAKLAFELIETDAELAATPDANQAIPSEPGVDETAVITFVTGGGDSFVQFYGQRIGEVNYFIVFEGTVNAATRRDSQVQQIASGFTISSLTKEDLSGVEPGELTPAKLAEFEAYVAALMTKLEVPGASIAIVIGDQVVYAQGFGVKEIGGTEPVTADTRMMIGSTTKSMTTMMMATEVDDDLMTWDQPVIEILPEFAVADAELSQTLTMRNLVCACTGVPRRDLEFAFNANELTADDVIASLAEFEFFTGFGEAFQYSNQMVATGGYAAAAAANGDEDDLLVAYEIEMQTRVFDPLGMERTTLDFQTVESDTDHATPHGANLAAEYVPLPLTLEQVLVPVAPAGLVWSTANDMGKYLIVQISRGVGPDGNRVVSTENLEETWVPQVAVDGETSYGLGWFVGDYKGLRLINHGGNTFGFTSDFAFLPDQGMGIVTLANAQATNLFNEAVRSYFFELMFDLEHETDAQIDEVLEEYATAYETMFAQIEDVPAEIAQAAVGSYESDTLGIVSLVLVDDVLTMNAGEFQSRMVMQKGTDTESTAVLVSADPPIPGTPFTLSIDETGSRTLVLELGTDIYTFREIPEEGATPVSG